MAPSSELIRDVNDADFDTEVIERSHTVPVLVDFWAAWCGPCRSLTPMLENAVRELEGKVELAKVDTEANPALAQRHRIMSIPAVKLFSKGGVIGEFVGALSLGQLRRFLREHLPSEADALVERANAHARAGDLDAARRDIGEALALEPTLANAHLAAARLAMQEGDETTLEQHIDALEREDPTSNAAEMAQRFRELLGFRRECEQAGGLQACRARSSSNEADVDARFALGCCLAIAEEYRPALEAFLRIVQEKPRYRDGAARKAMVTLFDVIGRREDVVDEFVRKLQIYT